MTCAIMVEAAGGPAFDLSGISSKVGGGWRIFDLFVRARLQLRLPHLSRFSKGARDAAESERILTLMECAGCSLPLPFLPSNGATLGIQPSRHDRHFPMLFARGSHCNFHILSQRGEKLH